jgi:hypothetical protein
VPFEGVKRSALEQRPHMKGCDSDLLETERTRHWRHPLDCLRLLANQLLLMSSLFVPLVHSIVVAVADGRVVENENC